MTRKNWYEKNPRRLKQEIEVVKETYPNFDLFIDDNRNLYWKGKIKYEKNDYKIKITYLSAFPSIRPVVFILTDDSTILENFQSTHQNKDGSICLYTYDKGSEGWKFKYTVKDVLDKLKVLLKLRGNKEIEEHHTSYFRRFYGNKIHRYTFIIPKEFQDFIYKHKSGIFTSFSNHSDSNLQLTHILKKRNANIVINHENDSWKSIPIDKNSSMSGLWYLLLRKPNSWFSVKKNKTILYWIKQNRYALPKSSKIFPLILFYRKRKNLFATAFYMNLSDQNFLDDKPGYFDADIVDLSKEIFKRNEKKIGKGLDILKNKKVIAIGLGSIGSSVVIELAKSGIGKFILYDPDILEFSNISKHIGDLNDVFRPKVNILEEKIKKINPTAIVETRKASPLDEKNATEFLEILESEKENSILIVTPAENETESIINEYSVNLEIPAIYGVALDGADYGRVFRVIPGITACYECISILNEFYPERFPSLDDDETATNLGEFEAYRHPGFPGMSIDVGFISLLISRIALQTLLRETNEKELYPDTNKNHILWSNRKGWIFDDPLQTKYVDYPKVLDCPICGEKSSVVPLTDEEVKEHTDLIAGIKREDLSVDE